MVKPGLTERAPWVVDFAFGLMHGLGLASGFNDAGLPDTHIPTTTLFGSIGVEAGHFLFIVVVLLLIVLARRVRLPALPWAKLVAPHAINSLAMFWAISTDRCILNQLISQRRTLMKTTRRQNLLAAVLGGALAFGAGCTTDPTKTLARRHNLNPKD